MASLTRRGFLLGLGATLAAPAIVRAEVIMPVRKVILLPTLGEPIPLMEPRAYTYGEIRAIYLRVEAIIHNHAGQRVL